MVDKATKLTRDDMIPEQGLADDFDSPILDAWFGAPPEKYKEFSQDPWLYVKITVPTPSGDKEINQGYGLGSAKQWEVKNNGSEVISAKKPEAHKFNQNARAGELVSAMIETVGGGDKNKGQDFFVNRGYYMTQAPFYKGLSFHWNRVKLTTVGKEERDVLMPTAFLGEVGTTVKSVATDADIAKIKEAAAKVKDEPALKKACLKLFSGNNELLDEIYNKGLIGKVEGLTYGS